MSKIAVSASDIGVVAPEDGADMKALLQLPPPTVRRMEGKGGRRLCIDVGRTEYMMETLSSDTLRRTMVFDEDSSGAQRRMLDETLPMLEAGLVR